MFKNTKIRTRLTLSYAVVVALTAVISVFGILNFGKLAEQAEYTHNFTTTPLGKLVQFSIAYGNVRSAIRDIAATEDRDETEKQKNAVESNWAVMEKAFSDYEQLVEQNKDSVNPEEYTAVKNLGAALVTYKDALFNKLVAKALQNDNAGAIEARMVDLVPPGILVRENIDLLVELNTSQSNDALSEMERIHSANTNTSISVMAAAVVCVLVLSYFVTSSVTKPVNRLIAASNSIAKGELNINIDNRSEDEIGVLSRNFAEVAKSVNSIIHEIEDMSGAMLKGDIDKRVNTSIFEGAYKSVAEGVNDMMGSIILEMNGLVECMVSFGNGDFNANIKRLPGKKAQLNESLDNMRDKLKSISVEINTLVSHAAKGELSSRADTKKYSGDWVKILEGLNSLMESVAAPINEAKDVLYEVSLGNFDTKMSGKYDGDFLMIKNSINSTVENIASYIEEIAESLLRLSQKDLSRGITREYVGEFSAIKDAVNDIISSMNAIITDIRSASEQVTQGARQISDSSMSLAQGASIQASSLEELNATVLTINESASQNVKNAKEAERLSIGAKDNAANGNKDMNDMLVSMSSIKESSDSISKIIKIIEDVAFQTNLLALNAAVEAARAGVHGKGFAVVAAEVSNLAGMSQNAAKETAELIEESISRVNNGTQIANKTASALANIIGDITKVSEIITNIAVSSGEQAVSINEITTGISQITEVVERTSTTAQESSSASEEFTSQAQMMQKLVSAFILKRG